MKFRLEINKIQHIERLALTLDLAKNQLTCIVGRNGIGKTTVVRALRNLSQSDTFVSTAPTGIFSPKSAIRYWVNEEQVTFDYDEHIGSLNCRAGVPQSIEELCAAELPFPHGARFNFFQSISKADRDIRQQIVLEEYGHPEELREFLSDIYSTNKFQALVETQISGRSYYSVLLEDGRYVREDYLSSGEYFLINLYRTIKGSARLIVVDEIDISLDPAAQVHLVRKLREFCAQYECNVVFTTNSLAMMHTLDDRELLYMERRNTETELNSVSYSYIRSLLFGFSGWDRYILTEDIVLSDFIETLIRQCCADVFFKYKIIHIGGAGQVVDLLRRNRKDQFLSEPKNVMAVLDGDQEQQSIAQDPDVQCLPLASVEKALADHYEEPDFPKKLPAGKGFNNAKDLFKKLQSDQVMSNEEINRYLIDANKQTLEPLIERLQQFLSTKA